MTDIVTRTSDKISHWVGSPLAPPVALVLIALLWWLAGLDAANITISIVSLLLLFIIQLTQNRDGVAIQVKLDELIRASDARNDYIGIDRKSEADILKVREE
jgi:low affinity Fe/Cu permease